MTYRAVIDTALPSSFEGWYATAYQPSLKALLVVCAGRRTQAEDAVNEAFSRAFERWEEVSTMASPQAWVVQVAINLEKRRLRRRNQEQRLASLHPLSSVADPHELRDDEVWAAVRALSPRQRRTIVLRYVEDWSQADIAMELDVAPGTIAATLHQARSRLHSSLTQSEGSS